MAKTKVAPVLCVSIPRLELEAARLGARLADTIGKLHSFPIDQRYFLSDSTCVLSWLNPERYDFAPFVAPRVGEIREKTEPDEWWKIASKNNVADDATKEKEADTEAESSRWFSGLEFLLLPAAEWPMEKFRAPEKQGEVISCKMLRQPAVTSSTE